MRPWWLVLLIACGGGEEKGDGTETDTEETDAPETDDRETADTDETEEPEDTGTPATPVTVANASFEAQGLSAGGYTYSGNGNQRGLREDDTLVVPDWVVSRYQVPAGYGVLYPSGSGYFDREDPLVAPADGGHAFYFDARDGVVDPDDGIEDDPCCISAEGSLEQVVVPSVAAGQTYRLTVATAKRIDTPRHASTKIRFYIDGGLVAETEAVVPNEGDWADTTLTYTTTEADAGQRLSIGVVVSTVTELGVIYQTYVDNVRLTVR